MFERLDLGEECSFSGAEPVGTVELELGIIHNSQVIIVETLTVGSGCGTGGLSGRTDGESTVVVTTGFLDDPGEETGGVVVGKTDVVGFDGGGGGDSLGTGVLELGD